MRTTKLQCHLSPAERALELYLRWEAMVEQLSEAELRKLDSSIRLLQALRGRGRRPSV